MLLPRGGALLDLQPNGALWRHNTAGWTQVDHGVSTVNLAPDRFTANVIDGSGAQALTGIVGAQTSRNNTVLDELLSDGTLWEFTSGSWTQVDSSVAGFVVAGDGALYELATNGQLWRHANGAWTGSDAQLQAKSPGVVHLIAGSPEYQFV